MIHALEMTHHTSCTIKYPVVFLGLVKVAFATAHPDGYMHYWQVYIADLVIWWQLDEGESQQHHTTIESYILILLMLRNLTSQFSTSNLDDLTVQLLGSVWLQSVGLQSQEFEMGKMQRPMLGWHASGKVDSPNSRNITPEVNDDSILVMEDHLGCSCDSPTLQSIEIMVNLWKKDWQSEDK
ncbi:hypothetical protein BDR03DRAFT_986992 [Suillus americanus]|nr:hypothetical protein BDR03DRAFT_986992 [Suillus americanus]